MRSRMGPTRPGGASGARTVGERVRSVIGGKRSSANLEDIFTWSEVDVSHFLVAAELHLHADNQPSTTSLSLSQQQQQQKHQHQQQPANELILERRVDGATLVALSPAEMESRVGIASGGHRKRIDIWVRSLMMRALRHSQRGRGADPAQWSSREVAAWFAIDLQWPALARAVLRRRLSGLDLMVSGRASDDAALLLGGCSCRFPSETKAETFVRGGGLETLNKELDRLKRGPRGAEFSESAGGTMGKEMWVPNGSRVSNHTVAGAPTSQQQSLAPTAVAALKRFRARADDEAAAAAATTMQQKQAEEEEEALLEKDHLPDGVRASPRRSTRRRGAGGLRRVEPAERPQLHPDRPTIRDKAVIFANKQAEAEAKKERASKARRCKAGQEKGGGGGKSSERGTASWR